jgi:hypothetical protein
MDHCFISDEKQLVRDFAVEPVMIATLFANLIALTHIPQFESEMAS